MKKTESIEKSLDLYSALKESIVEITEENISKYKEGEVSLGDKFGTLAYFGIDTKTPYLLNGKPNIQLCFVPYTEEMIEEICEKYELEEVQDTDQGTKLVYIKVKGLK